MRRKDKEITDKNTLESILKKAKVCRIGLAYQNIPYVVPMNFAYQNNILYLHSAYQGQKVDIIKQNNNICFEIEAEVELLQAAVPCDFGMKYQSIIGLGKAIIIEDIEDKKTALDIIVEKYAGKILVQYPEQTLNNIVIIKIVLDTLTGKQSGI